MADDTAGEPASWREVDPGETGFEATERLQQEFPAEDWADPEDLEEVQRVTADFAPEQMGMMLEGVLTALSGDGELDCEALAEQMMTTPEKPLELAETVIAANLRMVTKNLFGGDTELHSEWSRWCIANHREEYVRLSQAVARTQSSKPFEPLVRKHMAHVRAEAAKAPKAAETKPKASVAGATGKPKAPTTASKLATADTEPWWEREEREWHQARGMRY